MQIDNRPNHVSGASSRSITAIATYRSAMTAAARLPTNANANPSAVADKVSISPTAQALMEETARRPDASDPLRAFRNANGQLTMDGVAEIQNLPARVRDAAKGMREVASLSKEINALEASPDADMTRLEQLRSEYVTARTKLSADLERAGLADKMAKAGLTIDQLLQSDTGVLVRLSSRAVSAMAAADSTGKTASVEKAPTAGTATASEAAPSESVAETAPSPVAAASPATHRAETVEEEKPSLFAWFMDTLRRKLAPSEAEAAAA